MRPPVDREALPTLGQLHGASLGVLGVAILLVVTTVLPAEWGIDPTGVGSALGLTVMGELKAGPEVVPADAPFDFQVEEITVILKPEQGTEVKAVMRKGDQLVYEWSSGQAEVFYDFHGEAKGAPSDEFTSYETGTSASARGTFEAPFDGVHGWYWKNRGTSRVTLVLKASGVYQTIGQK